VIQRRSSACSQWTPCLRLVRRHVSSHHPSQLHLILSGLLLHQHLFRLLNIQVRALGRLHVVVQFGIEEKLESSGLAHQGCTRGVLVVH